MNSQSDSQVNNPFGSLGVRVGDTFSVSSDCLTILEEILRKLIIEDKTLRTFRRAIGFGQNIRKDLIPLLIHVRDERSICDAARIIDTTIEILVNLTSPVECLMSIEAVSRTDIGRHTVFELNRLLSTSKEAFADSRSTKAVVDHIRHMVDKDRPDVDERHCDSINNCLLLLRNILHIPDAVADAPASSPSSSSVALPHSSVQNEIIWNLFTQSVDKVIIYLISCPQKLHWDVTMVQLIALMYKDQRVGTLQKLLNLWLEASLSESSEDNESNTSPPDQGSIDSSPIITSDPTSDSSDTGSDGNNGSNPNRSQQQGLVGMKRNQSLETENSSSSGVSSAVQSSDGGASRSNQESEQPSKETRQTSKQISNVTTNAKTAGPSSQSEVSDCGYGTQVENQESVSTSSNDDDQPTQKPVHQKPHTFQKTRYNAQKSHRATSNTNDKKDLRRKKLVKRSKTNIINMKGLLHHSPTSENISNILKEFTVDFLLKGYGTLVHDLHAQMLSDVSIAIDTSHFFWLVTYFLKFATQLELDLENIGPVLSYDIISYLIFQGVCLYEELEVSCSIPELDLKPCLRRLHLVVTAIREFLQALEMYLKLSHISEEDKLALTKLQKQIMRTEELKWLFLLLLRQYNPKIQSRQYLQDLIVTNHNYLLSLDNLSSPKNMMDHLKQFATVEMMRQYGLLLESFKENGEFVNNCVFTMMHHIGGDLKNVPALFQPSILKTFSLIWETDYEICDDWSDLIEYVIHTFINTGRNTNCASLASTNSPPTPVPLYDAEDKVSTSTSSKCSQQNVWTQEEKASLLVFYNQSKNTCNHIATISRRYEEISITTKTQESIIRELFEQHIISRQQYDDLIKLPEVLLKNTGTSSINADIKVLKEYLCREKKGHLIQWLQNVLLETCYVKLRLSKTDAVEDSDTIMEPSIHHHVLLHLPVPIVPWTSEQKNILKHQPFTLLLHKFGFFLPTDTGKLFVRIPYFWSADYLFSIAQQLGPINSDKIKFNMNLLNEQLKTTSEENVFEVLPNMSLSCKFSMAESKQTPTMVRYTPSQIETSRLNDVIADDMDVSTTFVHDGLEQTSTYETASVASDLTRMCVSDEDEKLK